jgi:RNA polymerase sigma-70 factor (ECF subfamily)
VQAAAVAEQAVAVLDPDVVFRADAGPESPLARAPITGAGAVAEQVLTRGTRFAPHARPAIVNGAAGVVVGSGDAVLAVVGFTIAHGRISAIDLITDRSKWRRVSGR